VKIETTPFATIEDALEDIREGKFVVVVDAADRENEGDLTIAAQFATPDAINFMATHGRGLICLCLTEERCEELDLRQMTDRNETPFGTAFTISIEAREGVTTGISAPDRARTIQVAIDPSKGPGDLVQPGHVFPLRARRGGVLQRAGQTEAAVDLARLAGLNPAGVVCEIMREDGTMARVPHLVPYCERHGIKMITVEDLIEYRRQTEKLVERMTSVRLPTAYGDFTAVAFRETLTGKHHVALVKGEVEGEEDVLVRVHSECLTGDVFHSLRWPSNGSPPSRAASSSTWRRREGASASSTSSGPTSSRRPGWTPSRRTSSSASLPTCASMGSAARSSPTSA
jgi:3,4-dihydroxy 2-butanone 4-phosphate synthase/GTP cyclohydrolase II